MPLQLDVWPHALPARSWIYSYRLAKERPLVGGGFDTFSKEEFDRLGVDSDYWQGAHSIYFETMAEHGFVGLILFMMLGISVFIQLSKIIKAAKKHFEVYWARDLAAMMQVSIVGYAVSGAFLELASFDYIYQIVAMTLILGPILMYQLSNIKDVETENGNVFDNQESHTTPKY